MLDWATGKVLAWRLSNSLTTDFCIDAVEEAIARFGSPEIFNTDQGSQFTDQDFIGLLKPKVIEISMDGKGAWRDTPALGAGPISGCDRCESFTLE